MKTSLGATDARVRTVTDWGATDAFASVITALTREPQIEI